MLLTLENILGYRVVALDGEIGKVFDFFIDDSFWRLRYMVVETGNWLNRRRVLISTLALREISADKREFHVQLTCEQVRNGPGVDTDRPVSRQQEGLMASHYGWPAYWAPELMIVPAPIVAILNRSKKLDGDAHLRSFREITNYSVLYGEERVGRLQDFVIDDTTWTLQRLVLSDGGWLDSRHVAISSDHILEISWADMSLSVDLTPAEVAQREPFRYDYPANREERVVYLDYCGRPVAPPPSAAGSE